MGWADLLIEMGIPYDSKEAIQLADEVMSFISREALQTSTELAKVRGPFPRWSQENMYRQTEQPPRRNATVTTVAPTGTISLIANCSSGIEPIYSVAHRRISFGSERLLFVHPLFEQYSREHGFHSDRLIDLVAQEGSLRKGYLSQLTTSPLHGMYERKRPFRGILTLPFPRPSTSRPGHPSVMLRRFTCSPTSWVAKG